jgi:SpoVK/Ycf46/Vps4 family AAA+-type ATPase
MSTPSSVREFRYDPARSRELVHAISELQREGGVNVLFAGCSRESMLELVNQLADVSGLNVHRINVSGLVGDRENQTRGNVREAFDNAKESAAILVLDHTDRMFEEIAEQNSDADEDAHTGIDYLFQRVDAFKGICILQVTDPTYTGKALDHEPQIVVRF